MRDHDISQRRACRIVGVDPKTVRRDRPPDYADVREAMKEIAGKRRRFGYRRIGVLLERKGYAMNHKKLYRLYREEGLAVKRRRGRKRARGSRTPMPVALRPNDRWSLDFLSDTFGASRRFRILAVNDDCCRENLGLTADTSISGARVARELDALIRLYGKPRSIVSDNGTEFTSRAILRWADQNGVEWHYIDPGKPQQNAFIESFNGSLRPLRRMFHSPTGQRTLTHLEDLASMSDSFPLRAGRHHFFEATSFRIALSSICSASSFFNLAFSSSNARSFRASDNSPYGVCVHTPTGQRMPPNFASPLSLGPMALSMATICRTSRC